MTFMYKPCGTETERYLPHLTSPKPVSFISFPATQARCTIQADYPSARGHIRGYKTNIQSRRTRGRKCLQDFFLIPSSVSLPLHIRSS